MLEPFSIRPGDLTDLPSIASIHFAASQAFYGHSFPKEVLEKISLESRRELWRDRFSRFTESHRIWIGAKEGRVVAFAITEDLSHATAGELEFLWLYIHPQEAGQGLGSRLLNFVFDDSRRRGLSQIRLWTLRDNERARRLYERSGLIFTGTTRERDRQENGQNLHYHEVMYARPL